MPNSCPVGLSCLRLSNRHIASGALARARSPPAGLVEPGALSVRTRASGRRTQECRQRGHRRLRGRPSYCADLRAPCQEKHELLSTQGLVRQLPECPGPAIRMVWLAAEFISPLKWADRHTHTHTHRRSREALAESSSPIPLVPRADLLTARLVHKPGQSVETSGLPATSEHLPANEMVPGVAVLTPEGQEGHHHSLHFWKRAGREGC